jgi:hypothetical protein
MTIIDNVLAVVMSRLYYFDHRILQSLVGQSLTPKNPTFRIKSLTKEFFWLGRAIPLTMEYIKFIFEERIL